jgi:hypothetical protein
MESDLKMAKDEVGRRRNTKDSNIELVEQPFKKDMDKGFKGSKVGHSIDDKMGS